MVASSSRHPALRSRCSLNGAPTSLRVLREVGRLLVDVNGQHAALGLRESATQVCSASLAAGTAAAVLAHTSDTAASPHASLHPCAAPLTPQLALLDRIAGTAPAAAELSAKLSEWQAAAAALRSLDALADEGRRAAMQVLGREGSWGSVTGLGSREQGARVAIITGGRAPQLPKQGSGVPMHHSSVMASEHSLT